MCAVLSCAQRCPAPTCLGLAGSTGHPAYVSNSAISLKADERSESTLEPLRRPCRLPGARSKMASVALRLSNKFFSTDAWTACVQALNSEFRYDAHERSDTDEAP